MGRCFDCLDEFTADAPQFAVLKKMRDVPDDWRGDDYARRYVESMSYDPVIICEDCASWYGDHAMEIENAHV